MTTTLVPASIRHKNPGAMGLGKSAKLFGATKSTVLKDGANNTIATFPTSVDGAGALFHLLYTVYAGMTIWDAMHKWGDGATLERKGKAMQAKLRTDGYCAAIERFSSWHRSDVLSQGWLRDPGRAIDFAKAMARHEAGTEYPMTQEQWVEAHGEFMTILGGGYILLDKKQPVVNLKPLEIARSHLGEREIPGPNHNEFIVKCFEDVGSSVRNDETAWCAAFGGAVLKAAGCAYLPGVLEARKYLNYGHALDEPEVGCIVIFWRESPSSWKGHWALVESFTATTLTIISGNDNNCVMRRVVPRTGPKSQVLGYRRPVSAVKSTGEVLADKSMGQKAVGALGIIGGLLWQMWNGITAAAHFVGEFIGVLPETAANVSNAVSTGQSLFGSAGIPWPITAGLIIAAAALAMNAYDTWKRVRKNDGALTKAPYETDDVHVDEGQDDTFGEDLGDPADMEAVAA